MSPVSYLRLSCMSDEGHLLGDLQISDRRGKPSIEVNADDANISIGELSDYLVTLGRADPDVHSFGNPVSPVFVEGDVNLVGLLDSQAGLGVVRLKLQTSSGKVVWERALWIKPAKFRDTLEFERIVADICDWRTALALNFRAATSAPWVLDASMVAIPPEERLVVLRAALERHDIVSAMGEVERDATRRLEREPGIGRFGEAEIEIHRLGIHLSTYGRRTLVPPTHQLAKRIPSLPTDMPISHRYESSDTPENRFVKHVGASFRDQIADAVRSGITVATPLGKWATSTVSSLDRLIKNSFYRKVGPLRRVELGSPALQRRRGHRVVLKAFVASRAGLALKWNELDTLVTAETRDVPSLYEIWCLIQLRIAIEKQFEVTLSDGHISLGGESVTLNRGSVASADRAVLICGESFSLKLWYNRSYAPALPLRGDGHWLIRDPGPGTWTKIMRPDFTIELCRTSEASFQQPLERPLLIHLDAKYRLKSIGSTSPEQIRAHAPDDIDKMHAYLFGITDSVGAFVLYPGDQTSYFRRSDNFSTIGAISLRPGSSKELGSNLREILDLATQNK